MVSVRNDALAAVDEIQKRSNEYVCVVLDIMMPPPPGWEVRTKDGLDTGIEILRLCRNEIIRANMPIIVLTNRALGFVKSEIDLIGFPQGLVVVRSKIETPDFLVSITVSQLAKQWKGIVL